jgi:hypothetical protein
VIKRYVQVGDEQDKERLLETFRGEIRTALAQASVTIIPTSFTLEQVFVLLEEEKSRLNKKKAMGFKDAAVLLSSLKYAEANGMRDCWFVSSDDGFDENAVRNVAAKRGITCRLIRTTGEATQLMKELRSSNISSLQADLAKAALAFMNTHLRVIQEYLDAHPLQPDDVQPFLMRHVLSASLAAAVPITLGPDNLIRILSLTVDRIHTALPDAKPTEGSPCSLTFHASLNAKLLVLSPKRSSPYYGFYYGFSGYGPMSYGQGPFTVDPLTIVIVGKARANFKGGDFVEPLIIESLGVVPVPETP